MQLSVTGGKGGNGCISFEVLSPSRKRPSGGSGGFYKHLCMKSGNLRILGHGGGVFVVSDKSLMGLQFDKFQFKGGDGGHGGGVIASKLIQLHA